MIVTRFFSLILFILKELTMHYIKSSDIDQGLALNGCVYLCGDLKKPNHVRHFPTGGYEIGLTEYREYTCEDAHVHIFNTEYNYVLEGAVKVLLIERNEEHLFEKGDMFIIQANEPYAVKALAGSRKLFSKVPGGNDKVIVEPDRALISWGERWENTYDESLSVLSPI